MRFKCSSHGRRAFVRATLALAIALPSASVMSAEKMTVYKSPTCGCCSDWAEHMKKAGFDVEIRQVPDVLPYEQKFGVPQQLASCHVATVGGYVVEGHVPAADVKRLLRERPKATGIAVPGMPVGSPGMEQGPRKDRYETLLFDASGRFTVFERH